jgi:monofunctional biosynthetic peptidoglycan transglycosylase
VAGAGGVRHRIDVEMLKGVDGEGGRATPWQVDLDPHALAGQGRRPERSGVLGVHFPPRQMARAGRVLAGGIDGEHRPARRQQPEVKTHADRPLRPDVDRPQTAPAPARQPQAICGPHFEGSLDPHPLHLVETHGLPRLILGAQGGDVHRWQIHRRHPKEWSEAGRGRRARWLLEDRRGKTIGDAEGLGGPQQAPVIGVRRRLCRGDDGESAQKQEGETPSRPSGTWQPADLGSAHVPHSTHRPVPANRVAGPRGECHRLPPACSRRRRGRIAPLSMIASPYQPPRSGRLRRSALALLVFGLLLGGLTLAWEAISWPNVAALANRRPQSTAFIDHYRDGNWFRSPRPVEWQWVSYGEISNALKRAVICGEDMGFFSHHGFERREIRQALAEAWEEKRLPRGASTITQQLAKNLWLSASRNPLRKLKEAALTRELEQHLSKRRILEIYLNVVEFGPGIYGAEAAARHYFGRSARNLSESQATELAASLPFPTAWHPGVTTRAYRRYVRTILRRMNRARWIPSLL